MYEVLGHPNTRALRLIWMLEELGVPYKVTPVMPQSEEARAANPSGKVPMLVDGDLAFADSVAGLYYLADKHVAFIPAPGSPERARHDSLLFSMLDELEGPLWNKAKHTFILPEKYRLEGMGATAAKEWERGLANLATRAGDGDYLTGQDFTIADLMLGHLARWAGRAKFAGPQDERLNALIARIHARPALAAADAKKDAA